MTVAEHAAKDAATLARIEAAFAGLTADIAWMKAEIVRLGGGQPPTGDAAILAELTDSSLAGIEKRLGPKNSTPATLDIWTRGQSPMIDVGEGAPGRSFFSTGLGMQVPGSAHWDYGSTEAQFIAVPDDELVITPNADDPNAIPNKGIGLWRLRTEEGGDGVVSEFSAVMWNGAGSAFPDKDSVGHVRYGMKGKIGRPIALARARVNRYDGGLVLYDESRGGAGYIGTFGTQTAFPPWSGEELPAGKIPLSLCLTSQNEFCLVGVHDRATGKGQVGIIALCGGGDLQQSATGNAFPADWQTSHPGLMNPGVFAYMKILGWVDLPIKFPTNISAACQPNTTSDRIEGPDGNAAYLNIWDISTQAGRDAFLAKNGGWVSTWGKACVTSKYENKAVMLDLTALFQGYRDQYFTTQANYDAALPQHPDLAWWQKYDASPAAWPYMKPEWTPTVGAVVNVPTPTSLLMLENGKADVAIGGADGMLRYMTFSGTPLGTVQLGPNITSLSDDKYKGGLRKGNILAVSRGDASFTLVDLPMQTLQKVQDVKMVDPVSAEVGDTHGVEMRYVTVADFSGKKTLNYRLSPLVFVTQGGDVFGMGPDGTDAVECGGVLDLPGRPFGVCGSNVN